MEFIKTGFSELDNCIKGYPKSGLTLLYGEGGAGKTALCLMCSSFHCMTNKTILYLDCGNNFSIERFNQICGNKDFLSKILIIKSKNFNEQHTRIKKLSGINNTFLIIVDSITHYYRRLYSREPELAKSMLAKQLVVLNSIASSGIPVIITGDVYSGMDGRIYPVGKDILKKFCKTIIKLDKNPRRIIMKKPDSFILYVKIEDKGLVKR